MISARTRGHHFTARLTRFWLPMHLLWLKMYVPTVEEPTSAPLAAHEFEEISGLVEESFAEGDDVENASTMLSSRERGPLPSATRIRRVPPSPTLSVGSRTEEPTLVDAPEPVPARLETRLGVSSAPRRKAARS